MLVTLLTLAVALEPASAPSFDASEEAFECELTMSMAPMSEARPAMSSAVPISKSTAELCSEAGDPRCQLQQGDSAAQPQLPKPLARTLLTHETMRVQLADLDVASTFALASAHDSGFLSSLFRPPR